MLHALCSPTKAKGEFQRPQMAVSKNKVPQEFDGFSSCYHMLCILMFQTRPGLVENPENELYRRGKRCKVLMSALKADRNHLVEGWWCARKNVCK